MFQFPIKLQANWQLTPLYTFTKANFSFRLAFGER